MIKSGSTLRIGRLLPLQLQGGTMKALFSYVGLILLVSGASYLLGFLVVR